MESEKLILNIIVGALLLNGAGYMATDILAVRKNEEVKNTKTISEYRVREYKGIKTINYSYGVYAQ